MKKLINHLAIVLSTLPAMGQDFKAERYEQSAAIDLNGNIEKVFPLFGAMEERNWTKDWNPMPVYPVSGKMEEGFVFQTPDHIPGAPLRTWVVAKYDPVGHEVKYVVAGSNNVVVITVVCSKRTDALTKAAITYQLTGLSTEGNEICHHLIRKMFASNLKDWESDINDYLGKSR